MFATDLAMRAIWDDSLMLMLAMGDAHEEVRVNPPGDTSTQSVWYCRMELYFLNCVLRGVQMDTVLFKW